MYSLSSWRNYLGSVGFELLHQKPARTVGVPLTAYVPGEVTQVSRMTDVQSKFLKSNLGRVGVAQLHPKLARTVGNPSTAYVPGGVTQVSRTTDTNPKFLENSPR